MSDLCTIFEQPKGPCKLINTETVKQRRGEETRFIIKQKWVQIVIWLFTFLAKLFGIKKL